MFIHHKPYYKMSFKEIIEYGEKCDKKLKKILYNKRLTNKLLRKTLKHRKKSKKYTRKNKLII